MSIENTPVLFSVECPPYCDAFIQSAAHLPLALQSLYDAANLQLNYLELVEAGENLNGILDISPAQQRHLESLTRDQSKSQVWMKYRAGRITASRLFQAVHTDPNKPAISLVRAICYPESVKFSSSATKYGCEHERKAIDAYKIKQQNHQQLKVTPAGLVIYLNKSCFGASPDSFLDCLCCGSGVLEVKCPYCLRDADIQSCQSKLSFLENTDGTYALKKEHPYFYQCQLQMVSTGRSYCDFVVWSTHDLYIERILLDQGFIEEKLKEAERLFWLAIIPELLGKWFTRTNAWLPSINSVSDDLSEDADKNEDEDNDDDGSWCYCKQPRGGAMVGCENPSCKITWFHMACLRINKAPKGKWYCPSCHPYNSKKRSKRQ